jgi:hypothetical protein
MDYTIAAGFVRGTPAMPKKQNDPEAVRRARVRNLFTFRYPGRPNGNDLLAFYGWLANHQPELLPTVKQGDDPYQQLKVDLHGFYRD